MTLKGTKEWADKTFNLYQVGCEHACRYCYAREMAYRFGRIPTKEAWATPKIGMVRAVPRSKTRRIAMFPSTHDITLKNIELSIAMIWDILQANYDLIIVSKPHKECIARILNSFPGFKSRIEFRFTIGSWNDLTLLFWEPGAPSFFERVECLELVRKYGFRTSVSIEPLLDIDYLPIIQTVDRYVSDTIWIGLINNMASRVDLDDCPFSPYPDKIRATLDKKFVQSMFNDLMRSKYREKIRWKDSIQHMLGVDKFGRCSNG